MLLWNQRKRFRWPGLLVLLVVSLLVWRAWPAPQPYYNGRSLAYWFKQLPGIYGATQRSNASPGSLTWQDPFVTERKVWIIYNEPTTGKWAANPAFSIKDALEPETEAVAAIRGMGTNALPFLFRKLVRQRSQTRELMGQIAIRCGLGRFFLSHFPDLRSEQAKATTALLALMPLPQGSVSQLQTLSTNNQKQIAAGASWVLRINEEYQKEQPARMP